MKNLIRNVYGERYRFSESKHHLCGYKSFGRNRYLLLQGGYGDSSSFQNFGNHISNCLLPKPCRKNSYVSSATENANLILYNTKSLFKSHSCKIQFINMLTECTYRILHHTFPTRSHVSKLFIQYKNCTKIQAVWYITCCYFPTCDQRTNSP